MVLQLLLQPAAEKASDKLVGIMIACSASGEHTSYRKV